MSKTIHLSDETYKKLTELKKPGQSYDGLLKEIDQDMNRMSDELDEIYGLKGIRQVQKK